MSSSDSRDASRVLPARARSLLTVRAAISSALLTERPCSRSLSLTCSYIRSHLLPFGTPLGGIAASFQRFSPAGYPTFRLRIAALRRLEEARLSVLDLRRLRLGGAAAAP